MSHTPEERTVFEEETPNIEFDVADKLGVPLSDTATVSLTLTVKQKYTLAVVNGRDEQNVKNVNFVSIDSAGHVIWRVQELDSVLLNRALPVEPHWVLFEWTYMSDGELQKGNYEFLLNVERREAK